MTTFSPFVYWAQNESNIFIKVDLKDVKDPQVEIEKKKIHFQSLGTGAQGIRNYEFHVDLYSELEDEDNNIVKVNDNKVDLTLKKMEKSWWPRLTSQPQKPAWLKIDFDRWVSEEDVADEDVGDIREDYPGLYEKLQKEEIGYRKEDLRKVYLTLYNMIMYVGFLYVVCVLCIKYFKDGAYFIPYAYSTVGSVLYYLEYAQLLEAVHVLLGFTKGGFLSSLLQVSGRIVNMEALRIFEQDEEKMASVFFLFLTWSAIEIIRYPFYLSQIYKRDNSILTWTRYSAWIILYPIGFACESTVLYKLLIHIDRTRLFCVQMPNAWNFTFDFSVVLRLLLLFFYVPAAIGLMTYMYRSRQLKLGKRVSSYKTKAS